ncbi:MAG: LytTR family transcriptional regulator [Defluviitaleaceae bacterium]|nr:LytTR family transcriptional regulator [Defluviitaleaceae bacterium]
MKIIFEIPKDGDEDSITISMRNISPDIMQLLDKVNQGNILLGYTEDKIHKVNPSDIYYVETVDRKTFFYCESIVYESKQKLYELEEYLEAWNFLRVGKSIIINLSKIISVTPTLSRSIEALLDNNEKVIVSRQYVNDLKRYLGI